jgi:predicted HD superfamily hydrolase involved in NAD metabolism
MKDTNSEVKQFAEIAQQYAEEKLKGRLLEHTFACAETAAKLAFRFQLDTDKAMAASYLHDVAKPPSYSLQVALARELGMSLPKIRSYPRPVFHGPLAALIAREKLGIEDPDILQAIECHSTGCAAMGEIAKVVFISDFIEFTRVFPGAAELRSHGNLTLDELAAAILARKIEHLLQERRQIDPRAFAFWNELVKKKQ